MRYDDQKMNHTIWVMSVKDNMAQNINTWARPLRYVKKKSWIFVGGKVDYGEYTGKDCEATSRNIIADIIF